MRAFSSHGLFARAALTVLLYRADIVTAQAMPLPVVPPAAGAPLQATPKKAGAHCNTLDNPDCSLFWLPLGSLFLPGLGQIVNDRPVWPFWLSLGAGTAGAITLAASAENGLSALDSRSTRSELYLMSYLLAQDTAFYSSYETYRYRVKDELHSPDDLSSMGDILSAPFNLRSAIRPEVFLPLGLLAGLATFAFAHNPKDQVPVHGWFSGYRPMDGVSTLGVSYLAGTSEEAFFRGFLLHNMHRNNDWNFWIANSTQAAIFSAAHMDFNPRALAQRALFGFYQGWFIREKNYSLVDAVFLHTWWDIIALTINYASPEFRHSGTPMMISLPAIPF